MTTHSPEDVRDGLARCFLRNGIDRPQWLADLAVPVVRTALEARDAEIESLNGRLNDLAVRLRDLLDAPGKDGSEEEERPGPVL